LSDFPATKTSYYFENNIRPLLLKLDQRILRGFFQLTAFYAYDRLCWKEDQFEVQETDLFQGNLLID
jgi:hypothetical protein